MISLLTHQKLTSKILDLHLYGFNGYIRKREDPVGPDMFCKKGVLRNLAKIHRKTPVPEPLLIKLQGSGLQLY